MDSVFNLPMLMTDNNGINNEVSPQQFWDFGYRAICGQAQNVRDPEGANEVFTKPVNLDAFKKLGFKVGVWGVTYHEPDYTRDATVLAVRAKTINADFMVMDAELGLKGANPDKLIAACEVFKGEKALSTLGAASTPFVYPIDFGQFLDAGWHILWQAYPALSTDYTPTKVIDHIHRMCATPWRADGKQHTKLNIDLAMARSHITIDSSDEFAPLSAGGMGRPATPEELVAFLRATHLESPDISIFMAEFGNKHFYETLKGITMQIAPAPSLTPEDTKAAALKELDAQIARWKSQGQSVDKINSTRVGLAAAVLKAPGGTFDPAAIRKALRLL